MFRLNPDWYCAVLFMSLDTVQQHHLTHAIKSVDLYLVISAEHLKKKKENPKKPQKQTNSVLLTVTALDFLVNACLNKEQQCSFSVSLFNSSYKWKEKNPTTHSQRKISNILLGIIFFSLCSGQRGQRDQSQLRIVNSISKYSYLEILTSYLEQQVSFTSS